MITDHEFVAPPGGGYICYFEHDLGRPCNKEWRDHRQPVFSPDTGRPYPIDDEAHQGFWEVINEWTRDHQLPTYVELWDENVRLQAELAANNRSVTAGQAAKILGVDRRTIPNMVKDGRLVARPQPGSLPRRFDPEENPILMEAMSHE